MFDYQHDPSPDGMGVVGLLAFENGLVDIIGGALGRDGERFGALRGA